VLLEREVIKIIGKRDDVGRRCCTRTTNEFLELFGLKSLRDLPTLKEFAELTPESRDIYERRIGEPLPGQGQGMDLQTHYEAAPRSEQDDEAEEEGADRAEARARPPSPQPSRAPARRRRSPDAGLARRGAEWLMASRSRSGVPVRSRSTATA
jgi:segregation and condensation protein B